ncbi:pyridoxal phosphate-dependent decarboxylase family protein [Limnofasciculus baicalensis]|uniref:Aminotransferase class V-fold PLP-dependent enzyme n=1 Tax=Limnofasciculus baicalensis BBK-W-15 TaxID=2699891 RepID=A0AAE3GMG5_9CYAN|nr:aminotransferase class V-fold PLP-dependent enzyme [Limnofasciculus baicalensis]MCP2727316.1 aminotransferase class V-fold PLP-dependent enzyme [Limnofasciculus baicalensis BBK-W-15]
MYLRDNLEYSNPESRGLSWDYSQEHLTSEKQSGLKLDAFSPKLFRKNAEIVISKLEKYLADSSIRGLALTNPDVLLQTAKDLMASEGEGIADEEKLAAIIDLYIKTGIQVHSPGYMGRQFSGTIPLAGVIDLVSSIVNQPSSFYEAAQLPNVVESIMADEFNKFIGWERERFAMVTTSGGSLASLTALLAARNDKFPQIWSEGIYGLSGQSRPAIAVGDAHYSISRAAGILGIGEDQIVRLPINQKNQICIEKVRPTLEAAEKRGLKVFCLVASAGTTTMGAFDPIDELADIAQEKNIWLHVDGAHGGSLIVSDQLRHKLKGIAKADSFFLDAHKMMFVPAPCTLLFYKNKEKSYGAFRQDASYVFEKKPDIYTEFDSAEQNFECTKRPLIMNLWVLWTLYGKALFADKINYLCQLTKHAYEILNSEADFQTIHQPEANLLCFRYLPVNLRESAFPDFQVAIRNRIREGGKFFISKVDVNRSGALRVVFMNHQIDTDHFRMLLDEIRKTGQELLNESKRLNELLCI